jgi:sugar phosphate isomerase/epimerase
MIAAFHTLGGFQNKKGLSLDERCQAARAGGFRKIGWSLADYRRERISGASDLEIRNTLARHDIEVTEIEVLKSWAAPAGNQDAHWKAALDDIVSMAAALHARHIVCSPGDFDGDTLPPDDVADNYRQICERAAQVGVVPLIEFVPWSAINSVKKAYSVIEMCGHSNAGIVLDTWHFFRGGGVLEDLDEIPIEAIKMVQISDAGPAQGKLFEDTIRRRRFPGEGTFELEGLMTRLIHRGMSAPFSIEIISDELDQMLPVEVAQRSYRASAALLESARRAAQRNGN